MPSRKPTAKTKAVAKTKAKSPSKARAKTTPKRPAPAGALARQWVRKLWRFPQRELIVVAVIIVALTGWHFWPQKNFVAADGEPYTTAYKHQATTKFYSDFDTTKVAITKLQSDQAAGGVSVIDESTLSSEQATIDADLAAHNVVKARRDLASLTSNVTKWHSQLAPAVAAKKATSTASQNTNDFVGAVAVYHPTGLQVPILMYHYTPSDFADQLQALVDKHYTTITMAQLTGAINGGGGLPAKPVVITFDDGYANQMTAFSLLQQYHMRATFYIINGGPISNWCIGANRRYKDPSQPPSGCGDAYLTWDQVRTLDASGLIEIGGHTIDHPDLTTLSAADQQHEIADSKTEIEQEIGHSISAFAYPYGDYNSISIATAAAAGYTSAVTTNASIYQTLHQPYTLNRVRDATVLP